MAGILIIQQKSYTQKSTAKIPKLELDAYI